MTKRTLWLLTVLVAVAVTAGAWFYNSAIGFPQWIAGHWVHPRVTWYWTGMPGYPYPAIVIYGYSDDQGRFVRHGPFIERGVRGITVVTAKTGAYLEGEPDGVFTEYQTFWGTKLRETRYVRGREVGVTCYPVPGFQKPPC